MKKILGLDLGSASIGWAFVHEDDEKNNLEIIGAGVRIIPFGTESQDFDNGDAVSKNADRRIKRGIRRLTQRYKLRRKQLIEVLSKLNMLPSSHARELKEHPLFNLTSLELYELRAKGVNEKLSLEEIGRIFFLLNQKRGFKSSRKSQPDEADEKKQTEYLENIKKLDHELEGKTIGQFVYQKLTINPLFMVKKNIFKRQRYIDEFNAIWEKQKEFYPTVFNDDNVKLIRDNIIYYQRKLKSQKHLISDCGFERRYFVKDGKICSTGIKVAPKSSPIFQEFRIRQTINTLFITSKKTGEVINLTNEQRTKLYDALHDINIVDKTKSISADKAIKLLGYTGTRDYVINLSSPTIDSDKTFISLSLAFQKAECIQKLPLGFDAMATDFANHQYYKLWHTLYSIEDEQEVVNALETNFNLTPDEAKIISRVNFTPDYGNLSVKAMRKIIPGLRAGKMYHLACEEAGYHHSVKEIEQVEVLKLLPQNSLRNPIVEKIINHLINLINAIVAAPEYGKPDEIRIELARQLQLNQKQRKQLTDNNNATKKENEAIKIRLREEGLCHNPTKTDILRYRLLKECNFRSLYTGNTISITEVFNGSGKYDVDHIIPQSRLFNDSNQNKVLVESNINRLKGNKTAYDFMMEQCGYDGKTPNTRFNDYLARVQEFSGSRRKKEYLRMKQSEIPDDFINRQLNETQYITKKVTELLQQLCPKKVYTTSGSVTEYLRYNWGLDDVIMDLNLDLYRTVGRTKFITDYKGLHKEIIVGWTKRDDHRHHAVDAIVIALTKQGYIQRLNTMNKFFDSESAMKRSIREIQPPVDNLYKIVSDVIARVLVSRKQSSKVLSKKINRIVNKKGGAKFEQATFSPRGALHEETIYGKIKRFKKIPVNSKLTSAIANTIANENQKQIVLARLAEFENNPKLAFKKPILIDGKENKVLSTVTIYEEMFVIRKPLSKDFKNISDIIDAGVRKVVQARYDESDKNSIKAFGNLEENPIYLNKEKGITVKTVRIYAKADDLLPLHKNELGRDIDFVKTGSNHHVALYADAEGNLQEEIVTFFDAINRAMLLKQQNKSLNEVIDRTSTENREFVTSLQKDDMFILNLDPTEVDFTDPKNYHLVNRHLYRVQKLSSKDYSFRLNNATSIVDNNKIQYYRLSPSKLSTITLKKVSISKLGKIQITGEIL